MLVWSFFFSKLKRKYSYGNSFDKDITQAICVTSGPSKVKCWYFYKSSLVYKLMAILSNRYVFVEPVKESATIYDAFLEKERQSQPPKKPTETSNVSVKKSSAQVKKKTPSSPKSNKKLQLEDAVKKVSNN